MWYIINRIIIIISFLTIIFVSDVFVADKKTFDTKDIDLQVVVDSGKTQYLVGEDLEIDVKLYNKGKKDIVVIGPLLPEGLRISLAILTPKGVLVYESHIISYERTYKNPYREIYLQPSHFYGTHFKIQAKWGKTFKFLKGKYIIKANYSNNYKGKKGNAITGNWHAKEVSITVLEKNGKK